MAASNASSLESMRVPSGYKRTDDFVGSETYQLGLRQMHLRLSLGDFVKLMERPDPEIRYDHNRRIDLRHAKDFSHYLLRGVRDQTPERKHQPMIPGIALFAAPDDVDFELQLDLPHEKFGTIKIDKHCQLRIWDGQHRTLGMHLALDEINEEVHAARAHLKNASELYEVGSAESQIIDDAKRRHDELVTAREKLLGIGVPITLTLTSDRKRVAAIFSDLNDKQKGMSSSVVTRLDDRIVFNRVAGDLKTHDFLEGLVDDERDTTTAANVNWISLRDLAAATKLLWLGYGGRWNDSREDEADDKEIYDRASQFLETLVESFPDLKQVLVDRALEPKDLRGKGSNPSLLSSATTVKALAVAYHDLLEGSGFTKSSKGRVSRVTGLEPMTADEIQEAFRANLPSMDSGDALDDAWKKTGVFETPFVAPTARGANVRTLAMAIMEWVRS